MTHFVGRKAVVTGSGARLAQAIGLNLYTAKAGPWSMIFAADAAEKLVAEIAAHSGSAIVSTKSVASRAGGKGVGDLRLPWHYQWLRCSE